MTDHMSPNSREAIGAIDGITKDFFYIEGTESTGAINVNIAGSVGTSDTNLTEIDGSPVSVDAGNSDSGTQRVVIADDQNSIETLEQTGLIPFEYDYIGVDYPTTSTEVYEYFTGGSGGTLVATVTVTYTDPTKAELVSVART